MNCRISQPTSTRVRCCLVVAAGAALAACDGPSPKPPEGETVAAVRPKPAAGFVEVARKSGLDFKMSYLPGEQGEKFKINLYDHGTGVAVADADGDGHEDVYFVNEGGKNGLFRNDGHGRFADVTASSGVGLGDRICVAAVFCDVEGDGDQDLYVTSTRGGNVMFRNDGKGRFTDVTDASGLTKVAHSAGATFFDYDRDGDLDLFLTNTAGWTTDARSPDQRYYEGKSGLFVLAASPVEHNVLYRNDGTGRFTDVTAEAGVAGPGWGGDLSVFDMDGDGWLDVFVANMFGVSQLYRNGGDGRFTDVAGTALGRTSWGAVGTKVFDHDGDGLLDMMLVDMHSDMWMRPTMAVPEIDEKKKYAAVEGPTIERGETAPSMHETIIRNLRVPMDGVLFGNTLFRNLGGGRFEEVSDKAGVETFWPWGIAADDFDQDGFVDLFLPSGMGYPLFYWRNYLLMNRGDGTFEDRSRTTGIEPRPGGEYLDDLVGASLATRSSRAAAVTDFDEDGRPDLVVVNWNERVYLYRNEFPKRRWVALALRGAGKNRDAIGALVTLKAGGRVQLRQVESSGGYLAQSTRTLHFGLGDAASVDSCEIRWPGGRVQKVTDLKLDAVNRIDQAGD
jgi:enediyne biosynthesis protein E4